MKARTVRKFFASLLQGRAYNPDWNQIEITPSWHPTWLNAPNQMGVGGYGNPDGRIKIEGDVLRCTLVKHGCVLLLWWLLFTMIVPCVAWYEARANNRKLNSYWDIILIFGAVWGIFFAIIYAHKKHHQQKGDYLIINRQDRKITLPRHGREFSFDEVVGFQWIHGYFDQQVSQQSDSDENVDLNLLVRKDDHIWRYHIMGNPTIKQVRIIAEFSEMSVEEINCDHNLYLQSDSEDFEYKK